MSNFIKIDGRPIGPDHPPYVVAEISGNHNGDLGRAQALVEAAAEAGVDAVKLQTYTPETITLNHDGPGFIIESGLWRGRKLFELYEDAHTPWSWHEMLFEKARDLGVTIFSSPFDITAVDLLHELGAPAFKIASFEMIDHPLIESCAATGKPLIISTGIATKAEISEAIEAARRGGCKEIILLHCVSGYPTDPIDSNLRTIIDLKESFNTVTGLSDHTQGIAVPVAAISLGACFIEKHFTLRRADGGPDAEFSLEPRELKELVSSCRIAWEALGQVHYNIKVSEKTNQSLRRSLYVVLDIPNGEKFTKENVRSIRPGFGIEPKLLPTVLGQYATRDLKRGEPLDWDMIKRDQ